MTIIIIIIINSLIFFSVSTHVLSVRNSRAALHRFYPQIGMQVACTLRQVTNYQHFFFASGWASLSKLAMRSPSRTQCPDPVPRKPCPLSLPACCSFLICEKIVSVFSVGFNKLLFHIIIIIIIINNNTFVEIENQATYNLHIQNK